jgi:tRNA(Ile)-lysidine synthetase-like protein
LGSLPNEDAQLATYSNNLAGLWSLTGHKITEFCLENQRLALGVSGGADSIGLFHTFCSLLKQKKIFHLVVFHINFGLRGDESDGDERFVVDLCASKNIPCQVFRPKAPILAGIQESARNFRLDVQSEYLMQDYKIALAHNSDDVAENVLLRLARGSAIDSAAGMTYYDDEIFRPWLDVSRKDIRSSLSAANLSWREDSSNETVRYTRNKIRHEVIPVLEMLFPGAAARIAQSFLTRPPTTKVSLSDENHLSPDRILMSAFSIAATQVIEQMVHDFLEDHYGGRTPVSRQVIRQISGAIHKISTGLDGNVRQFSLPKGKTLHLSQREIGIRPTDDV